MTLALLITAVGGAWAAEETLLTTITATGTDSYSETTPGVVTVTHDNDWSFGEYGWIWSSKPGSVTVTAKEGYTITRCVFSQKSKNPVTVSTAPFKINFIYNESEKSSYCEGTDPNDDFNGVSSIEVYGYAAPAGPEVTVNEAKTEASFDMPTYNVDLSYELVRNMSVQMQAQVGDDATKQPRYRVQSAGESWVPAELNYQQVMALFSVNDLIENTKLAPTSYSVNIYAVDAEGQPTGDAMTFQTFTFAPGRYCVTATAPEGIAYEGTTAPSNIFEFYQGYQVVIPAGEYVTYYKDEAVRLDEKDKNDIELCTITAIEDGKAVLSENFDAMKANTPFLLKNTTTEEKTILLIPCTEPNLAVTVAKEFKGTEGACEFSEALMATGDFYVCNGKEFIKVRGAGTLAANKAYLFVEGNNTPASIPFRRSIGGEGEGTTSIDASLVNSEEVNSVWYDLNGRRLQGKPSQKGIYIKNGKKIVVK